MAISLGFGYGFNFGYGITGLPEGLIWSDELAVHWEDENGSEWTLK